MCQEVDGDLSVLRFSFYDELSLSTSKLEDMGETDRTRDTLIQ